MAIKWVDDEGERKKLAVLFDTPESLTLRAGYMQLRNWQSGQIQPMTGWESD